MEVRCPLDNLGDDMVARAIDQMFEKVMIISLHADKRIRSLDSLLRIRHIFRYSCLGGGTLIFANTGWLHDLEYFAERTIPLFTCGTGVIDPDFREHLHRPIDPRCMERWIACLQKFRFVSVRGIESQRILREHGLTNVEVIGDPALFYCRNQIRRKTGNKRIGINLSSYSHFWSHSQATTVREIGKVILWLSQHNWKITIFPSMPEDEELSTSLLKMLGLHDVEVFREYRDVEKLLSEMEVQDIFIGVKLHTVIAACCVYTPAIMIGYQPKCYDFMKTMGLDSYYYIRSDRIDADGVISLIEKMIMSLEPTQQVQFDRCQSYQRRILDFRNRVLASLEV